MTDVNTDVHGMEDPERQLEESLIHDFVTMRGLTRETLAALPDAERAHVLAEASMYAAGKLAEVEARARFVRGMHEAREADDSRRLP